MQTILTALQNITGFSDISENVDVVELQSDSVGKERQELTEEEREQIPDDETVAAILPTMTVNEPAVYVFSVETGLPSGSKIVLRMMAKRTEDTSEAAFFSSEAEEDMYTFLDDDGKMTGLTPAPMATRSATHQEAVMQD